MRRHLFASLLPFALALALATPAFAAPVPAGTEVPAEKPLLDVAADPLTGKIIATLPKPDASGVSARYIYLTQLGTGLGSAPIGLDRASASDTRILVFRRIGKKVAAEIENSKFVASSGDPDEQHAVDTSFATSTLWMSDVINTAKDGSYTVDIAGLLARDDFNVPRAIKNGGGGEFKFVPELSAADPNFVKVFPKNAEFAAKLTFRSDDPKAEVTNIINGNTLTIVLRHSLIALPEPGFVARTDPYGYTIGLQKVDFSAPLGAPIVTDLARRFRLEKVDPSAARSPVKKPIVFYIDRSAPEPVRTALVQGVSWWSEAFEAAGFENAFKVEVLPEGTDPLDVRYNVVNWVDRATRGWSYGQPIADPRTGEIIKGSVLLGSLRTRQDLIIFQALVGAGLTGTGDPNDPIAAALARIRQLGAHEVGHALGLAHNFAASTQGRYSVMDYPGPRITLDASGAPSLRDSYGVGLGPWDKFMIKWLYAAKTDIEARPIVAEARTEGLRFVADNDARPLSAGQPLGSLWDDGADPIAELRRIMAVRSAAVARFGTGALPAGESLADLRRSFVPIWLLDRYQIEAAAKSLGGVNFPYVVNGESSVAQVVPGSAQWAALYALLDTLTPAELTVPARLDSLLSSGFGGDNDRQTEIEIIPTAGGPVFDPLKATEVGAEQTLEALLATQRLNRLEGQHSGDPGIPAPSQLFDQLIERTMSQTSNEVGRRIATMGILGLARVQHDASLSPTIAMELAGRLDRLADQLQRQRGDAAAHDWAHGLAALLKDRQALDKALADPARYPRVPPGMPIGEDEE
ncbi:MAG TPA: zinc-dependent metalloprotease [Sphingomicrobium sp.]|nr:zinc-dependent metalloprotease [Sphingomicrobium sp.]